MLLLILAGATTASAQPLVPPFDQQWQWKLSAPLTQTEADLNVPTFDIDGEDNTAARIAYLHSKNRHVICYFSAGSSENWRSDYSAFPASVKGRNLDGWAGEKWLDIRQLNVLMPIMQARLDRFKAKGCDSVEPDNVDGYTNNTGFPLTGAHQIAYLRALSDSAHQRGLMIALKNDVDQVQVLEPYFDFAINEECQAYSECGVYSAFTAKGKAVLHVEYSGTISSICKKSLPGMSSMKKRYSLTAWAARCA